MSIDTTAAKAIRTAKRVIWPIYAPFDNYWRAPWARRKFARTPWPTNAFDAHSRELPRVGVVVANYNTANLISQLIFSLHRIVHSPKVAQIVVVDNASTDGSIHILEALHNANLIHLIKNQEQQYHGKGLNQGVSWLARTYDAHDPNHSIDYVLILDSDVILLRDDIIDDSIAFIRESGSDIIGQLQTPVIKLRHNPYLVHPSTLFFDAGRIWKNPIPPFYDHGSPAEPMEKYADRKGRVISSFPYADENYVIHLGGGTLSSIAAADETDNRYYGWAVEHSEPHFLGGYSGMHGAEGPRAESAPNTLNRDQARANYERFLEIFQNEVPVLDAEHVVNACLRDHPTYTFGK
jgi:hypothetical protein